MNPNYNLIKHDYDAQGIIHPNQLTLNGMQQMHPLYLQAHQKANSCLQFEGEGRKMEIDVNQ
jgi:hypothetical protein